MRKIIQRILLLLIIVSICFMQTEAQEVPDDLTTLYARSAVLMDADSGRVLFGKNEKEKRPMASTTKIMTCILALERMDAGQEVQVSDYAASQPKVRLGVRGKEKYLLTDLLYSLMLESHNDSAVAIAEGVAGTVGQFAYLMNEKAKNLGCTDTHFVTPNGLDDEDGEGMHETTAADLARIMRYCILQSEKKEEFLKITQTKDYTFQNRNGSRTFSCHNHNAFLDMMEGAISGKTGFTAAAGYCYVGALQRGERTFIVTLLACGWPSHKDYKWVDMKKLMNYALENYEYRFVREKPKPQKIVVTGGVKKERPFMYKVYTSAAIQKETPPLKLLMRKEEEIEMKVEAVSSLRAPVEKGDSAGRVQYFLKGQKVGEYKLLVKAGVDKRSLFWCMQEGIKRILL